ncbi:class I SAM-dependent methyltransferase [Limnofasciculus baicalensis]|uniref:Class I SAM-dependent methyltransferase n=1 Tax=Limnofasciculus baicalensis BBK-W-15 TaxID=2699891 RepID=A0AAE3GNA2_9CYAN|nr:methyltransferase domain-containing protein [Limnofasciculus baicalensis]MCP2726893.1 class I SAM-dependent methyltransferase [Limnofasciculus baicalensis BBK-W-15]
MATVLRNWSYQYQWLYDGISQLAALAVGGERRFHYLPLQNLTICHETKILDLCCGSGQATRFLVEYSQNVTGLDASPLSLGRAKRNVPQAGYVEGLAEEMPLPDAQFDIVHTSVALHEMTPTVLRQIIKEVHRVLKPGGIFTLVDFHKPTNFLFWPGVAIFLWLFETETAWQLLEEDLVGLLEETGFKICEHRLYAGGSLQVIQVRKVEG